jgi:hypothetical protein
MVSFEKILCLKKQVKAGKLNKIRYLHKKTGFFDRTLQKFSAGTATGSAPEIPLILLRFNPL